jgi:hypothetical protein
MAKKATVKADMRLASQDFPQRIADRYATLGLFTLNFSPHIFTERIAPFLSRWVELVYAMPYLMLRRETSTLLKETSTNIITQPIEQIWNILVYLEGTSALTQHGQQPLSYLRNQPSAEVAKSIYPLLAILKKFDTFKYQNIAYPYMRNVQALEHTPLIPRKGGETHYAPKLTGRETKEIEGKTPIYARPLLERKTSISTKLSLMGLPKAVREKPAEAKKASGTLRGFTFTGYPSPVINYQPLILSHTPLAITHPSGVTYHYTNRPGVYTSDSTREIKTERGGELGESPSSRFYLAGDKQRREIYPLAMPRYSWQGGVTLERGAFPRSKLNVLELARVEHAYRNYPRMETVLPLTSVETTRTKKEEEAREPAQVPKPPQPPQPPKLDVDRLADKVYQLIERRVRIERERRGL